jgi:hypothetical protein
MDGAIYVAIQPAAIAYIATVVRWQMWSITPKARVVFNLVARLLLILERGHQVAAGFHRFVAFSFASAGRDPRVLITLA